MCYNFTRSHISRQSEILLSNKHKNWLVLHTDLFNKIEFIFWGKQHSLISLNEKVKTNLVCIFLIPIQSYDTRHSIHHGCFWSNLQELCIVSLLGVKIWLDALMHYEFSFLNIFSRTFASLHKWGVAIGRHTCMSCSKKLVHNFSGTSASQHCAVTIWVAIAKGSTTSQEDMYGNNKKASKCLTLAITYTSYPN
jgi:hypothetical protein